MYEKGREKWENLRNRWRKSRSATSGSLIRHSGFLWKRKSKRIGNDFPRGGQIDFVLGHFTDEDLKTMDERVATACDIIKSFCLAGISITMNQYNKK